MVKQDIFEGYEVKTTVVQWRGKTPIRFMTETYFHCSLIYWEDSTCQKTAMGIHRRMLKKLARIVETTTFEERMRNPLPRPSLAL